MKNRKHFTPRRICEQCAFFQGSTCLLTRKATQAEATCERHKYSPKHWEQIAGDLVDFWDSARITLSTYNQNTLDHLIKTFEEMRSNHE